MDFEVGADILDHIVGHGDITGTLEVNQVYAAPIERGFWVTGPLAGHTNHPRHGGQTHFLRDTFVESAPAWMARIAERVLEPDGQRGAMVDAMEEASAQVAVRAPVEFGDLRRSGHPYVTEDGAVVYDRPPAVERLSRAELEAKSDVLERGHDARGRLPGAPWATHTNP